MKRTKTKITKGKRKSQRSKKIISKLHLAGTVSPTPLMLHEIFIGCCDMTEHIDNNKTPNVNVKYTADELVANKCFKTLKMNECMSPCKPSKTGKLCLPDQESIESTFTKNNEHITNIDFKFNSKYDGKLIKLIATIPLSVNWKIKNICVYEYNHICCVCFPSGFVSEVRDYKYNNEAEFNIDNLIHDIFKMYNGYNTYLFCGHSMGGSCAQYICSLDWKDYEIYKLKCYLITTGAFECLTEDENDRLRTHFHNKKWCYCNAMLWGNKYLADNFVGKHTDNYVSTDLIMLLTNDDDSVEVVKLNNNSNYIYNSIKGTFHNKNQHIINALHEWAGTYKPNLISVLSQIQSKTIDIQNIHATATIDDGNAV